MTPLQHVALAAYRAHCRATVAALRLAVWCGASREDVLAGLVEVMGGACVALGDAEG